MAVEYFNNQLYDVYQPSSGFTDLLRSNGIGSNKINDYNYINGLGYAKIINTPQAQPQSSSQKVPSLQPYINRMTQQASDALYGGLLGYQTQPMQSGQAGGQTIQTNIPQWGLPSSMPKEGGFGFGNRSWMKG